MLNIDTNQKPAPAETAPADWSPAYIIYRLRERGTSLRRLARLNNYSPSFLAQCFHVPLPKAEKIIADTIGVDVREIFPSRYKADGTPKPRNEVLRLITKIKHSTRQSGVNVCTRRAA